MNKSERFWDLLSKIYDEETVKFEQMYAKASEISKQNLCKSDIVLEIGCGTGTLTNEIANYVKEIQAIDISSRMIDIAKRKADETGINNVTFKKTSVFDKDFKKESFNVILAFNILHCIEAVEETINKAKCLLNTNGLFISVTPSTGNRKKSVKEFFHIFWHLLFLLRRIGLFPIPFIKSYKISELKSLVVENGFRIIETENFHTSEGHYCIVAKKK